MIFIFYIILSSFLYYVLEINGFSVNNRNEAFNENEVNSSFNNSEIVTESGSVMSKHKSLFHIIQNPNEAPDLKSNIFDKMLSNEMLSIKQQLYDKTETNVSPFYITFKNNIGTPTLELKQRWPIDKSLPQSENAHKNADINTVCTTNDQQNLSIPKSYENDKELDNKQLNDSIHSKILGVRSFAAMPVNYLRSNHHQCTKRQCTCMKTNAHSTCSFRCSEHSKQTCTQTEKCVTEPQCTRNVMPFSYYPYYVYSTLFLGIPTDSSIAYYHPDVINELKLPNHKHSQHKKPSVDNLYLESDDNDKYYDEKEYFDDEYSDEENPKIAKHRKSKYQKGKTKGPKKVKMVYFIDFKKDNPTSEEDKLSDGYLQVLDRDKFVENVIEDLKVYHSDAVIKDCYCSLSSFRFTTENFIIYVPVLITLMYK